MKCFKDKVMVLFVVLFVLTNSSWAAVPPGRFIDLKDGTMLDTVSHLRWLKNAGCIVNGPNWATALQIVANLKSGDCTLSDDSVVGDWKLPSLNELRIFIDDGYNMQTLFDAGFTSIENVYWSSDSVTDNPSDVWGIIFIPSYNPSVTRMGKSGNFATWPVRKGTWVNAVISVSPSGKDFGIVTKMATSEDQTFILSNSGTDNLVVSSITLTDGDSGMFALVTGDGNGGTCGATPTILPGGTCNVSANFKPTSGGPKATTLRISSNATVPNKDFVLKGNGFQVVWPLNVTVSGIGSGTVASLPVGIMCDKSGSGCSGSFNDGDKVTLTPAPSSGTFFAGWSGDCTGNGTCAVTMTQARSVTATFNTKPVSWWKGESNTDDSIGNNNGTMTVKMTATAQEGEKDIATATCTGGATVASSSALYGYNCNPNPISCNAGISCPIPSGQLSATSCSTTFSNSLCKGDPCPLTLKRGQLDVLCAGGTYGYAPGTIGQAFSFVGGREQYVSVPHSPSLDLATGHTVAFWIKPNVYPLGGKSFYLVNKWKIGAEDKRVTIDSNGKVGYYLHGTSGILTSTDSVPLSVWTHIAVTYDGSSLKLYVDGVLDDKASVPVTGNVANSTGKLYLGVNPERAFEKIEYIYDGLLDEVRWYNVPLTADEVKLFIDAVPDAFNFPSKTGVALNTQIESDVITVNGINKPVAISIVDGEYALSSDGGATWSWTNAAGSVNVNDQVKVRLTSSASYNTPTTATLTIGGVNGTFTATTPQGYELTVKITGTGGGSVNRFSPADFPCLSGTCKHTFPDKTTVELSAKPNGLSTFDSWADACSGNGACSVLMDAAKSVTATFALAPVAKNITSGKSFPSLAAALIEVKPGEELRMLDTQLDGVVTLDKGITLRGGWYATYMGKSGLLTILNGNVTLLSGASMVETIGVKGKLVIQGGSLRINGVTVQP